MQMKTKPPSPRPSFHSMSGRPVIPPGKAGAIILAAALAPVVLRKLKPLARAIGKGFSKVGESVIRMAEEPHDEVKTEKAAEPEKKPAAAKASTTEANPKPKPRSKTTSRKPASSG